MALKGLRYQGVILGLAHLIAASLTAIFAFLVKIDDKGTEFPIYVGKVKWVDCDGRRHEQIDGYMTDEMIKSVQMIT